jgi:hypothetical protein
MEDDFEKQIKDLAEKQSEEVEQKKSEYSQKMLDDATRYQELQKQKEEEQRHYRQSLQTLKDQHESAANDQLKNHNDFVMIQRQQIEHLKAEIETMMKDNEETMRQI